jgi:hypothetical protein
VRFTGITQDRPGSIAADAMYTVRCSKLTIHYGKWSYIERQECSAVLD